MDPIVPPPANSFASDLVQRGATLAAIGNCDVCHTAPGGREFAGGRALPTPFGTVYATNITPDSQSGIGTWSKAAFKRAMRSGVRRDGAYLYPAFPYDHFTLISDEDNAALYAFLMTRAPVRVTPPANELPFPLNMRPVVFGCCSSALARSAPTPRTTRPGIVALISSKGSAIAAPAIRRAIF